MKTNKSYSFINICLLQFLIYALLIVVVCFFISLLVNWKLDHSFVIFEDILEYEEYLKNEDYGNIPIEKMKNCSFAVYDEDKNVIYNSNDEIIKVIDKDEINFINDFYDNTYYSIYSYESKNKDSYVLFQNTLDDNGDELMLGYATLNNDLKITGGNILQDKEKLTQEEIDLIKGIYKDDKVIEKYTYENDEGKIRILLFSMPSVSSKSYDEAIKDSRQMWILSFPFILLIVLIETYFFNKKLKENLSALKRKISDYQTEENIILPKEFQSVVNSFDELMRRLDKALKEKDKSYLEKQKVIANLSHDLKTPLTVIKGYSKAFIDGVVPSEKTNEYMQIINNKCNLTVELIDDLCTYAKLEHPKYELNKEKIDICKFSKEYLASKYDEIEFNNMQLDVIIPAKAIWVNMDTKEFKRVYDNLINNSIKYNNEGTKIYFSIVENKNDVNIFIGDNGCGISKDISKTLFEPFITGNEARTSGTGLGLGMSIVKSIVLLHDGTIRLVTKKKKNLKTEFKINLKKY